MHLARPPIRAPGSRRCPRCARLFFAPRSSANTPLDALQCTARARCRLQAAPSVIRQPLPSTEERCRHVTSVLTRHQHPRPSRKRMRAWCAQAQAWPAHQTVEAPDRRLSRRRRERCAEGLLCTHGKTHVETTPPKPLTRWCGRGARRSASTLRAGPSASGDGADRVWWWSGYSSRFL